MKNQRALIALVTGMALLSPLAAMSTSADRDDRNDRRSYGRVNDYGRYDLHHPPHGYEWRRSNTGDFILAAVATGVIMSIILSNY